MNRLNALVLFASYFSALYIAWLNNESPGISKFSCRWFTRNNAGASAETGFSFLQHESGKKIMLSKMQSFTRKIMRNQHDMMLDEACRRKTKTWVIGMKRARLHFNAMQCFPFTAAIRNTPHLQEITRKFWMVYRHGSLPAEEFNKLLIDLPLQQKKN